MLKDLGFVAMDLAKICGQWWLWVKIWWCRGGLLGFFWIWVLLLSWWLWLAEVVVMAKDDNETASGELCFIFFLSFSCSGFFFFFFFINFYLGRNREREGLICCHTPNPKGSEA